MWRWWIAFVVSVLYPSVALATGSRMDEPFGSRYMDYQANAEWSPHYGVNSDGGWPTSLYPKFIEDLNNDGMADAIAFGKPGTYVSMSNGTSFVGITEAIANFGTDQAWEVAKHPRFVVDISGDGFKDVVGYGIQGIYGAVWNPNSGTPQFENFHLWSNQFGSQQNSGFYLNPSFIRTFADVNNDKKADAVVFANDGVHVALSDGTNFGAPTLWIADWGTDLLWNNTDYVRQLVDVNGDGFVDILGYGLHNVLVSLNTKSNGFGPAQKWGTQFSNSDRSGFYKNPNFIRTSGDVNGDDKIDLVVFADDGVYVGLYNGTSFATATQWVAAYGSSQTWNNTDYKRVLADVNGDSKMDIVGFGAPGTYFSMSEGTSFAPPQLWVTDFGYNQAWRDGIHPRFMRDVNGDTTLDITGYGDRGVLISASAPLYCCDKTYYHDPIRNREIINGILTKVHLPTAYNNIVMPTRASTCASPYFNNYRAVGPNNGSSEPWLNTSWRIDLGARFAVNANFFDIGQSPMSHECSNALGLAVSQGGLLSQYSTFNNNPTWALVVYNTTTAVTKGHYGEIMQGTSIANDWQGKAQFIISGTPLIFNGSPVTGSFSPDPNSGRARTSVGLTRDGNTMIFITQNDGVDGGSSSNVNATLAAMADALLQMGAYNAINLDGSGSAQMWFKNNVAEFKSVPSDGGGLYRGVPAAFGVK